MGKILSTLLIFILLLPSNTISAQGFVWGRGSTNSAEGAGVTTDNAGNIIVIGWNEGNSTSFGPYTVPAGIGSQPLIAKYDPSGNILWAQGVLNGNAAPISVATDGSGNIYFYGQFISSTIDIGTLSFTTASEQFFLVKYDPFGNVKWARADGRMLENQGGVATDAFGNVYIAGEFTGTASIGPYTFTSVPPVSGWPDADIFIAKYDTLGNLIWVKTSGGNAEDYVSGIAVSASGNVYVSGTFFSNNITFGTTTLTNPGYSVDNSSIYIAKYDSSGNVLWAKSAGGHSELVGGIACDANKNPYIVGTLNPNIPGTVYTDHITFGTVTLTNPYPANSEIFVAAYDSSGNATWANGVETPVHNVFGVQGYGITVDPCNSVWICGRMDSVVIIDGNVVGMPLPTHFDPYLIAAFNSSGTLIDDTTMFYGGDDISGIASDPSGNIFVCSDYEIGPFIIGADTLHAGVTVGADIIENVFVAKYTPIETRDTAYTAKDTSMCAGNNITLHAPAGYTSFYWDNDSSTATRTITSPGTYYIRCFSCGTLLVDTFHVVSAPEDTSNSSKDTGFCSSLGVVTLSGPSGYSLYSWNTGATTASISAAASGIYVVTATEGCDIARETFNLVQVTPPIVALGNDTLFCSGNPVTLSSAQPNGNTFVWSTGSTEAQINVFVAGAYWLKVTDANGCYSIDTAHVILSDPSGLSSLTNVTTNETISYGTSVQLNADGSVLYFWKPDDGTLNNPNINNPIAAPLKTTIYTVYGYNVKGCVDSESVTISVDSTVADCIPTAFTPNGDGRNDIFRPTCMAFQQLVDFRIYNRWGQQVFYSNSYQKGWDGTFNGVPQDFGVYYYYIIIAKPGDNNITYKGDVTLIR